MTQKSVGYPTTVQDTGTREGVSLDDVLATDQLSQRSSREPDFEAENLALHTLSRALADNPDDLLQTLVETILNHLPSADSAGVSNYIPADDGGIFRWDAVAGLFADHAGESISRDKSPCVHVVDRNEGLLFDRPGRYFDMLADVDPPVVETLLVPFYVHGEPVGTVWAVSHTPDMRFDMEDERLLTSLSSFASAGYQFAQSAGIREDLEARVRTRTDELEDSITQRKRAERKARQSRDRHRAIFDYSLDGILLADDNGRYVDANEAASELLGYSVEELLELSVWDLAPDQNREEGLRMWRRFLTSGSMAGEFTMVRKDGTTLETDFRATADIVPGLHLSLVRDISERKRAEEAMRQSEMKLAADLAATKQLQNISAEMIREDDIDALYERILDAAIALMNADAGSIQGYYPEKEELKLLASQGFHPESAEYWEWVSVTSRSPCGRAMDTGKRIVIPDMESCESMAGTKDLEMHRRSGIRSAQSTPLFSRSGEFVGMITTHWCEPYRSSEQELRLFDVLARQAADLIERTSREEELKELNETLEERVRTRTAKVRELASRLTMAEQEERRRISQILHDHLQQLLFSIQLKMSFVHREADAVDNESLQAHIDDATARLDDAIETTRQLTVDLSPPVLQGEGLTDTLQWLRSQMRELHALHVTIEAEHAFRIPDEDMRVLLFQIVRELLFNVVKHADTDHATVALYEEDDHLVMRVTDNGQGFDVAEAEQASDGGFGLFSVRERLNLFGGRVEVASRPGDGTRVTVYTPVTQET